MLRPLAAEWVIKSFITEHLEQEQVFVVGHDVSGPPLAHMAAYNPKLVKKLFFTETEIDGPEMGEILLQHINEIWHFLMNAARLSPSFASGREEQFIPQFFTQWVYNVAAIQPENIAEYVRIALSTPIAVVAIPKVFLGTMALHLEWFAQKNSLLVEAEVVGDRTSNYKILDESLYFC